MNEELTPTSTLAPQNGGSKSPPLKLQPNGKKDGEYVSIPTELIPIPTCPNQRGRKSAPLDLEHQAIHSFNTGQNDNSKKRTYVIADT